MANKPQHAVEVQFARDLTFFDAVMIGLGGMIGAGVFVLTGIACGEAGPAAVLAFACNAGVTLLTAMSYAELSSAIPQAGGGYSFIRRAFSPGVGFLAGWMLWFAYTVACALYARGFAGYFVEFVAHYMPNVYNLLLSFVREDFLAPLLALVVGVFFTGVNVAGAMVTGKTEDAITMAKMVILALFVSFGFVHMAGHGDVVAENFRPMFPKGVLPVFTAMGLTFIAFQGYDLIATVSEEIKDPERTIPRAIFWSVGLASLTYLCVVLVAVGAMSVSAQTFPKLFGSLPSRGIPFDPADPEINTAWEVLGEYGETGIVRAAENFMPKFGVLLIVAGGVFSTMSALNGTVLAGSRVAFAMGRDRMLPGAMGRIHHRRRTPHVAIIFTGLILIAMATLLPIETVGSAASLLFLLCFALTNLSAILIRLREPELNPPFKIPLFPLPPVLGVVASVALAIYQFKFQPMAWYVSLGWMAAGVLLYLAYLGSLSAPEQEVIFEQRRSRRKPKFRVLVPVANPATALGLVDLASALARAQGGDVVVLSVVEVPAQLPLSDAHGLGRDYEAMVQQAVERARERGVSAHGIVRLARRVPDAVLATAAEEECDLLLMGWRGWTTAREAAFGSNLDEILRNIDCAVAVYRAAKPLSEVRRFVVPAGGGPHARYGAYLASLLADPIEGATVRCIHVVPPGLPPEERHRRREQVRQALAAEDEAVPSVPLQVELVEAPSIARGLVEQGRQADMLVMGSSRQSVVRPGHFGQLALQVARSTATSVLLVRKAGSAPRRLLQRLISPRAA